MILANLRLNNLIVHCYFSNKKYPDTIQRQIVNYIFLIQTPNLIGLLKIIVVQNQLPISFGAALIRVRILKVKRMKSHPTHTNI